MRAGRPDALQVLEHIVVTAFRRVVVQQLAVADHRVERGAQFVCHAREEVRFRPVGGLCLGGGLAVGVR